MPHKVTIGNVTPGTKTGHDVPAGSYCELLAEYSMITKGTLFVKPYGGALIKLNDPTVTYSYPSAIHNQPFRVLREEETISIVISR